MCECGWCWCGAPASVVEVLKFALRFSTLNFSNFLIVISYAEQTTVMSSFVFSILRHSENKNVM